MMLEHAKVIPFKWDGEDKNIQAFASTEAFVAWFSQGPGEEGQPYRDRGFYTRELDAISKAVRPKKIVEFGTSLGIGTCLLHWMNPDAKLITVDIATATYMPGDVRVRIGLLAKHNFIPCYYACMPSSEYADTDVDLCFIDGDHSYAAVKLDSERAWGNKSSDYAIVWHDYNDRHPGVVQAVNEFCDSKGKMLHVLSDSDTVWIRGTINA